MSTALNDRDAILQAASVRVINPKNADILMKAEPSLFHVNAAGAVDVAETKITATLIGLEGDVTFTVDGAVLTSVTGKTAVVRYIDMQGPAAIVTARIVAGGQPFAQSCIIGVVRDGTNGSDGGSGARGAGMYFASGNAWSDGTADAATPGGNVLGDVVTISNGGTYAMTKRWDGASWLVMGAIFDGSLFVTGSINGAALKAGTVNIFAPDGTLLLGAGGEFGAKVRARNLVVGTPDNIVPDPEFRDLTWWDRVGRASVSFWADQGISTFWQSGSSMYLSANAGESLSTSRSFPVTPGATYIIKCQVSLSNDFNGYFSLFATIPGYVDHNMTGERVSENWNDGMPVHLNYASQKGGRTFVTKLTLPVSGTLSKAVIQIRNRHTIGSIEIGSLSITRVADGSLVDDGAVEARHVKTKSLTADLINVTQISAISSTIGRFATADSGARVEIRDNIIEGFNVNNTRRFRISA